MDMMDKEIKKEKLYAFGRICAILNDLIPGGLSPDELDQAFRQPGLYLADLVRKARPQMTPRHDERLVELIARIDTDDLQIYGDSDCSIMLIGYYHEKKELAIRKGDQPYAGAGRPRKGSRKSVDWSDVDWSKSDAEIGRLKGVARQTARSQRLKHQ